MAKSERRTIFGVMVLGLTLGAGCYAGVGDFDSVGNGLGEGEDAGDEGEGPDGLGPAEELPAPTTRFFRLTHQQWENTVQDLLYLDEPTGLSTEFRADPLVGGFEFDNNAMSLIVDQALWSGYQRAADQVGELVAADPTIVEAIAPDTGDEATRGIEFVRSFGARAFRHPLTATEEADLLALYDRGPALYENTQGVAAGVRFVIEAVLQSPHFLYRVETSGDIVDGVIPLNSWETASRLSYFLWDSMPDAELIAAAQADELGDAEAVEAQAWRMLESPRAEEVVERFHHQLLRVDKFSLADPSPAFYPDVPQNIGALALEEHDQFLRHTVFDSEGSWRDLLTSTDTFVNDELAALYGVEGEFGPEFTQVELDPTERAGLFTQIGFLVANATPAHPDPIHRGAFMAETIVCHTISAPPNNLPPIPAPEPGQSNRETVTALTEAPGSECLGCHKPLINPLGFAFEHYDSTGAYRVLDNDLPVDASGRVLLGSEAVEIDDAVDLAAALANSEAVHQCYLEHWMEFAMGRPFEEIDEPLAERLALSSHEDTGVKELLVELATSRPFLTRAAEEMQ